MSSLYLLIPLSLLILMVAISIFFWAIRSRQFEDMEGPAQKVVLDDLRDYKLKNSREKQKPDSGE